MRSGPLTGSSKEVLQVFGSPTHARPWRRRQAVKRGGRRHRAPLDDLEESFGRQRIDVVPVGDAVVRLALFHERQGQVLTLRVYGGFTVQEVARQLEVSVSTVESDYRLARAWLHAQLG